METLDVKLSLTNLHCFDEGDGSGSAEPYLWTVFFKIDGNTVSLNPLFALEGTATIVGTAGNHADVPNHDVDAGEDVPIPAAIGQLTTQLKPIPLQQPIDGVTEISGVLGVIAVVLEEDNTSDSAVARAHLALNRAVRNALNGLIPTLRFNQPQPTDGQIEAMKNRIRRVLEETVRDALILFSSGTGDMDDVIGSVIFPFSHNELEARGAISFQQGFKSQGDWLLQGRVTGFAVGPKGSLRVVISGIPDNVIKFPVRVTGPGFFSRTLGKTETLTNLVAGTYTVTASGFDVGDGKPTCKIFTPDVPKQQATVTPNHLSSVSVNYASEPCDINEAAAEEPASVA